MADKIHVVADDGKHTVAAEVDSAQAAGLVVQKHIESIKRHGQFQTEIKVWVESAKGAVPR